MFDDVVGFVVCGRTVESSLESSPDSEFCIVNESFEFWQRGEEQALKSYTMREVFSMDSTVRIDAIQNLNIFHGMFCTIVIIGPCKFYSNSVVEALLICAMTQTRTCVQLPLCPLPRSQNRAISTP
ncbi:uncharacterized protein [Asterias amurensis]|uniref:uncharacterized protein isoform X1 n=1 Tax=Asterias amurensis TaxID=7602 RepID=UPI003AB53514